MTAVDHNTPATPTQARRFSWRRMLQYRLRTILILTTIAALALGWQAHKAQQQRNAVAALRRLKATILYDKTLPPRPQSYGPSQWPAWFKHAVGQNWFGDVSFVSLREGATNAELRHVARLPRLEVLLLNDTMINNSGLVQIEHLTELVQLELAETCIDDDGLRHIERFNRLTALSLYNTPVTDVGLKRLEGLTGLQVLDLQGTRVTERGVARIKQVLPNCQVEYQNVETLPVVVEGLVIANDCNKYCWYTVTPLKMLKNSLNANVTPSFQAARLSTWSQVRDGGTYLLYLDYYNPSNPQWGMRIEHFKKIHAK